MAAPNEFWDAAAASSRWQSSPPSVSRGAGRSGGRFSGVPATRAGAPAVWIGGFWCRRARRRCVIRRWSWCTGHRSSRPGRTATASRSTCRRTPLPPRSATTANGSRRCWMIWHSPTNPSCWRRSVRWPPSRCDGAVDGNADELRLAIRVDLPDVVVGKLGLPDTGSDSRRVLAVLLFLRTSVVEELTSGRRSGVRRGRVCPRAGQRVAPGEPGHSVDYHDGDGEVEADGRRGAARQNRHDGDDGQGRQGRG